MKHGLFEVASVVRGDGNWTAGASSTSEACGRLIQAVGICTEEELPEFSLEAPEFTGARIEPFAIYGAQEFAYRCGPDDYQPVLVGVLDQASEYMVTKVFWEGEGAILGDWPGETTLANPNVHTIPRGEDEANTLADLMDEAYERNPGIKPIVHMGMLTAQKLAPGLDNLEIDYVVGPGYPKNALAVTGPIKVWLGSVEGYTTSVISTNRFYVEATRLAAIDFDLCLAVRAA